MSKIGAVALACTFIVMIGAANAGNLDSPGTPSSGSSMYSLSDIYEYLITGLEPVISNSFQEPSSGSGATGKTTKEIYDDLKALFDQATVMPSEVLNTVKFFSTYSGSWGPTEGTMPNIGRKDFTPGTSDQPIDEGYHNGGGKVIGDADLVAGNIASGVDIFGVEGTADVASGDAATDDVLSGKTFSNDSGAGLTGAMTNVGAQNITPKASEQTIDRGYHDGAGKVAGDADLTASNIKDGIVIFGVTGTVKAASGNAEAGDVLSGKTFSNDSESFTGTMADNGAATINPGTSNQTIAQGYHNGSGTVNGDGDLVEGKILSGVTIFNVTGNVIRATGAATNSQVLDGVTYSNSTGGSTGTMPDKEGDNASTARSASGGVNYFTAPAGYYDGDDRVSATDAQVAALASTNLISDNLKYGVTIFGVSGENQNVVDTGSANANAGNITAGKKAWVNGTEVTGTFTSLPAYPALVPETGQTYQYDANASQNDDGGVDSPGISIPTPRFLDNGDGSLTDNLTGLIWLQNSNCPNGLVNWQTALDYVRELNTAGTMNGNNCGDTGGQNDWRLPTINEIYSLVNNKYYNFALSNAAGTGQWSEADGSFTGVQSYYWSSTTYASSDTTAWFVAINFGIVDGKSKSQTGSVWPVRGGQ